MDFWIQAIGIVAMALNISAFQFKSKRTLLMMICVGSALFSINMFLLGAITGGIMNLIGVVRSLVYVAFPPKNIWSGLWTATANPDPALHAAHGNCHAPRFFVVS